MISFIGNVQLQIESIDNKEGLEHEGMEGILRRFHIYDLVECQDPNGNTPLSEAGGKCI